MGMRTLSKDMLVSQYVCMGLPALGLVSDRRH